jgi:hypothetical protein
MDRRLPPHARRTLRALWRTIEASDHDQRQGLPEAHARRVVDDTLGNENELSSDEEINHHLDFLQNCGEIYFVDDWIRITDPEEVAAELIANEDEENNEDEDETQAE